MRAFIYTGGAICPEMITERPKAEDICIEGLKDITLDTIKELLTVDKASWLEDVENIKAFYAQVGDRVPETMYDELAALEARLKA